MKTPSCQPWRPFLSCLCWAGWTPRHGWVIITWQTPVNVTITDPTQVITSGPLAALVAAGAQEGPLTVNGVAFPVWGSPGTNISVTNFTGATGLGYGPRNSSYSDLLGGGDYTASGNTANIIISNLVPTVHYEVQIFTPYWDANYQSQYSDGTNSVLMGNTLSQPTYVIGTFTATATTETIFATAAPGSNYGITTAVQVLALPEPASGALLGLGALFALRRRRPSAV